MPLDPKQQPPYYTPGTTPTPALTGYTAGLSLTQVGTNNPTTLVLWNELQYPISSTTRLGVGWYRITFTGAAIPSNKTIIMISAIQSSTQGAIMAYSNSNTTIDIVTKLLRSDGTNEVLWEDSDDRLLATQLLIIAKP